jgi:hypothetical protein
MLPYFKFTGVRRFAPAAPREQPHRVVVLGALAKSVVRWRSACLVPHTNGPRDVPRCGAMSKLKIIAPKGGFRRIRSCKTKFVRSAW